ncbi:MAG: cupin domain-containing protein [Patescibacteria group bacterium]
MNYFYGNIEELTLANDDFRQVIYTGPQSQLVLMTLQAGEEIGFEVHNENDQFFRLEEGKAEFTINEDAFVVGADEAVIVPRGAKHNVRNVGEGALRLYTIYTPAHHPDGTVHHTKAEADAYEEAGDH